MSAFCSKYPNCGCVGIGTKCYDETTQTKVIGVTGGFLGCNTVVASSVPCLTDNRGLSKKKIKKNLQKQRRIGK